MHKRGAKERGTVSSHLARRRGEPRPESPGWRRPGVGGATSGVARGQIDIHGRPGAGAVADIADEYHGTPTGRVRQPEMRVVCAQAVRHHTAQRSTLRWWAWKRWNVSGRGSYAKRSGRGLHLSVANISAQRIWPISPIRLTFFQGPCGKGTE